MARKGRDLFEILRERQGGGRAPSTRATAPARGAKAPGRAASPRGAAGRGTGVAAGGGMVDAGRGAVDWVRRKIAGTPEPAPAPTPSQSGLVLAAVAALALLLGFLVGRVTSGGPADAPELRVDGGAEVPDARVPQPILEGDAVTRAGVVEEEKKLADEGFLLLVYPDHERTKAASAAVWLRAQGLPDTRIRSLQDPEGDLFVGVICYTRPTRAAQDLATLRSLAATAISAELADALRRVDGPQDVRFEPKSDN